MKETLKWWQTRLIYQIYPRSFMDSNNDGIGDIPGIISKLDILKSLGAGAIWLSPVYVSPDADNGYDIADYHQIDKRYGTMADMEALIQEAAKRDIKIIMDLVINHTSSEHEWFQKSRKRIEPYTDYYIWKPSDEKGRLPNNWTSAFQGSAWEFDDERGEYYLHLFDKRQPDLNYHNPLIIEEIKNVLRFWLDKGIAGFRCDVINLIYKTSLEDGKPGFLRGAEWYANQEGCHRILQELRRDVLDSYDAFTVGETFMANLEDAKAFCNKERAELDMVFNFDHLQVDRLIVKYIATKFRARKLLAILAKWQNGLDWNAVVLENHDQPRIVSHYGSMQDWEKSAKLLAILQFTLRGTPFVYQGQEIGMSNFDFTDMSNINDVESLNMESLLKKYHIPARLRWKIITDASRDNARTPLQWNDGRNAGWTKGSPWLKINSNYTQINYKNEIDDADSVFHFYQKMIRLREDDEDLLLGDFNSVYSDKSLMVYKRGKSITVLLNFSGKPAKLKLLEPLLNFENTQIIVSNTGRLSMATEIEAWEAIVLKENPV
ncbi:MAG: alpha-glucosidase [Spirochaetaceae bacterium]|nr:alpha-glucosidase [Spirochaetaceae bacterium]